MGFLFYAFFIVVCDIEPGDHFWNFYIEFLNPLHDIEKLDAGTNIYGSVIHFFGRIFVGFGIYQTIAAFRRFNLK